MKPSLFLPLLILCLPTFAAPNLVVIMVDDMGYQDVGFNGCTDIPTPHIDSIAQNGVRFSSGYVAYPVCGPSRASFMTGRYGQRFGFERNPQYKPDDPNMGLTRNETTIAESLKQVGYHSGAIGKWHLGAHETQHPLQRGFQEFYGHLGGGHKYFPEDLTIRDSATAKGESESYRTWILKNSQATKPRTYLTDEFSDEAVSFVARNHDKPFFLFLAYNAPHTPLQASEKYLARFADIADKKRRTYAAMVSAVDDGVGRLLSSLREHKVEDETLVFFLSDNGGPEHKNASNNGPLRDGKGSSYDGGWRVPFAAQWPGTIPAGKTYDQPIISLDVFATIAALSNAPIAKERPLDGVNLIPFLTGKQNGLPHEALYLRKFDSQSWALRSGDFKLVIPSSDTKPQLYKVSEDLGEKQNLAAVQPEVLKRLDTLRTTWAENLVEPTFRGLIHLDSFRNRNKKTPKKQNVVLIVCDDLNDYGLGIPDAAGHPQVRTPHINRLARSGVAFRHAYSNAPVCAPSRASFLTGIYPHTSGNVFWNKWHQNPVLKNSKTLMAHFRDNGYQTIGAGKLMHHAKADEWDSFPHKADYGPHAFDGSKKVAHTAVPKPFSDIGVTDGSYGSLESLAYLNDDNPKSGWVTGRYDKPKIMSEGAPTPDERNAKWAADKIAEFAKAKDGKPFFLGVGFIRPHTPLHVPQRYFDRYPLDTLELPEIKPDDAADTHYAKIFDPEQKGLRYFRELRKSYADSATGLLKFTQAYLASVSAVDDCIGEVVSAIDKHPTLRDNTIIVFTSDHGWNMGQKDYLFKNSPWEESTRVPFIVRAPGVSKKGAVADQPISLIDLYPSLVDLCGLSRDTRKNADGAKLDGHSIRPFLEDPTNGRWKGPEAALSMIYSGVQEPDKQHYSLRTRRHRYIRYNTGAEELYDHDTDPQEWQNLADSADHAQLKKRLSGMLDRMCATGSTWDWFAALDKNKDGQVKVEEWLAWGRKKKGFNDARQRSYFATRDADSNGWISRKELLDSIKKQAK